MNSASELAYIRVSPFLGSLQTEVLAMIRAAGPHGLTSDGAEQQQSTASEGRIFRRSTITSRFSDLKRLGLIRDMWDDGLKRKTRSGCYAAVCVAIEFLNETQAAEQLQIADAEAARKEAQRVHAA